MILLHLILLSFSQITDEHYAGCGMRLRLLGPPGAVCSLLPLSYALSVTLVTLTVCVCGVGCAVLVSNRPVRVARFAFTFGPASVSCVWPPSSSCLWVSKSS